MYYKEDWMQARERFKAFWNGEIIDRCCIAVTAPRKHSNWYLYNELYDVERFNDHDTSSITKWWTDPEEILRRNIFIFENTFYGGEAFPLAFINWGAMPLAAFFGSKATFNKKSVWYDRVIEDWDKWTWKIDKENNEYWKMTGEITRHLAQNARGRFMVGMPELGDAADVLSLMRGMDDLCLDLLDCPEKIKESVNILTDTFLMLQDELYEIVKDTNDHGGILPWMSLWMPGKHGNQLACDFSWVISPEMFREFFVPGIMREGSWSNYGTYHLDGPGCLKNHLDTLLDIKEIKAIEWTPGAGSPPSYYPEYIPVYKRILEKGKRLILLAKIDEVEDILSELSPKGLYIITQADSEDEARDLLKKAEKLSCNVK